MYFDNLETSAETFIKHSNHRIETIFHSQEFQIYFKLDHIVVPKTCYILAEKISDKEMIQIRIAEKHEHKMYTSTINIQYFNILRTNQSLHVTFMGFIDNLIKILQNCQKQQLQISIVRRDKENEILLQFYETHSFKNLIHLSLPIEEASLAVVNYHLYRIIDKIQKQTHNYESTIQDLRNQINTSNGEILEIKKQNHKLHEEIAQQKQLFSKKQKAELDELRNKIRNLTEAKESDENQFKKLISQLQSKIDLISLEKANVLKEKGEEIKKYENLKKENMQLKTGNSNLKQSNDLILKELDFIKNSDNRQKHQIIDLNKKLTENDHKISHLEKFISDLKAELQAEKNLCHNKRNALEVASEEINKANNIITKQSAELLKLKKTIDWRTEVALQQELSIEKKESAIMSLKKQIQALEDEFKVIRNETCNIPLEITSIKHAADSIENKYRRKILDLKSAGL